MSAEEERVTRRGESQERNGETADPDHVDFPEPAEDGEYTNAIAGLRWYMRLYFFHPFKLVGNAVSFHFGYCAVFLLQILKVTLITVMLFNFGHDRGYFNNIVNRGHTTLRNLLMEQWDASWETLPYPPSHGEFAVYTKKDIIDRINYAVNTYYNIEDNAIGYFTRPVNNSIIINMRYFDFEGFEGTQTDGLIIKDEILVINKEQDSSSFNLSAEFEERNLTEPIKKLLLLDLRFHLHSVRVFSKEEKALCLDIHGNLTFSDLDNNGQVIEDLKTLTKKVLCSNLNVHVKDWDLRTTSKALAGTVLATCLLSLLATVFSTGFAFFVFLRTKQFMKKYYVRFYKPMLPDERDLPRRQYLLFFRLWDIFSLFADVVTLYGTIWIAFNPNDVDIDIALLDTFTVWLGVGCLVAWFCLLRYFKFHIKFHLLFTTIYRAFGDVLAYLLCVGTLFIGFWACGYVVLSPYHVKFATPEATTETLLAVVNGDEIFATLAILDVTKESNSTIWWFSRVFMWTYVAIFTIVVLNLLVAIVLSAYEVIKSFYEKKEEDRDLGPLEVALQKVVENVSNSSFRQSITNLVASSSHVTQEEDTLRAQLQRLFRISDGKGDNGDIVPIVPKTLKAFMNEGAKRKTKEKQRCSIIMSFELGSKKAP